jgi:hypothetical protein
VLFMCPHHHLKPTSLEAAWEVLVVVMAVTVVCACRSAPYATGNTLC